MASDDSSPPDAKRLRRSPPTSTSPDHLLVDEILTRLPIATAVRLRAVSRDWNAALTSDHFILAHRARASPSSPTAASRARVLPGGITSYLPSMSPWDPFELSTTGLGFDAATGEHKVVRLFKERNGEHVCEVYTLGKPGGWRPCTGRVPASAANFLPGLPPVFVNGYLYWLLQPAAPSDWQIRRILSFSVGAEQFGSVYMPPRLSSVRCSINLDRLPCAVSDELMEERVIVPLCTAGGRILLATGRHEVFAYDAGRNAVERVFRMQEFVDVPNDCREARLLLSVGLHDECIADLHPGAGGERMLFVNTGRRGNTVVKREVPVEYHDDSDRRFNVFFKDLATMAAQI
uniref:Uncharacterized protein n=1 Tax=Oryza barthii TaxID=65489 RepID=A0A0D3G2K2_9ORYZ